MGFFAFILHGISGVGEAEILHLLAVLHVILTEPFAVIPSYIAYVGKSSTKTDFLRLIHSQIS